MSRGEKKVYSKSWKKRKMFYLVVDGDYFVYMKVSCMERASMFIYFIVSFYIEERIIDVLKDQLGVER